MHNPEFGALATAARGLYLASYYNASSRCFADCMYVSQLFGLSLGLLPAGSPGGLPSSASTAPASRSA